MEWEFETLEEAVSKLRCSKCGSALVRQVDPDNQSFETMQIDCTACGKPLDKEDVFETAIEELFAGDDYRRIKDGAEPSHTTCPVCRRNTWVRPEGCVFCGSSKLKCSMCGESCWPDDYDSDSNMCSYCSYRMEKIMRE